MDTTLTKIFDYAQSIERSIYEPALSDLRYLIERETMSRHTDNERKDYFEIFYNKNLIDYRVTSESLILIRHFLIYLLFNFPDRATLVAKCIKVLFDTSIRKAICIGIKIYMKIDDDATCELILAITDIGDVENYLSNEQIRDLLVEVAKFGGKYSKEAAVSELNSFKG